MPLVYKTQDNINNKHRKETVMINSLPPQFRNYSTIILSIAEFRYLYIQNFGKIAKEHRIAFDEEEYLYDWLVTEGVSKVLTRDFKTIVFQHYKHDIYRCVYDLIGHSIESLLTRQLHSHNLQFLVNKPVKVLVTADNLILAKSSIS